MKRIRITDLDLAVLVFISDMKFASAEMVRELFFTEKGSRYPKKRLKDYQDEGLVSSIMEWGGRGLCYFITDSGTKFLQRKGVDVVPHGLSGIDLKNYEHDKVLSNIRIKLELMGKVTDWFSERRIRNQERYLFISKSKKIIPDAYCVNSSDEELIVEFENSRKSNDRIKGLLKSYQLFFASSKDGFSKVVFFFASGSLLLSYKKFYQNMNLSFPVQFISVSDLGISNSITNLHRSNRNV